MYVIVSNVKIGELESFWNRGTGDFVTSRGPFSVTVFARSDDAYAELVDEDLTTIASVRKLSLA